MNDNYSCNLLLTETQQQMAIHSRVTNFQEQVCRGSPGTAKTCRGSMSA